MSGAKVTPGHGNPTPRGGNGRWRRGIESVERDAEACRMYVEGATFLEIADALGYGGKAHAHRAIQRVLMDTIKEPAEEVRAREIMRAQEIYMMARAIARKQHPLVSGGKVIYGRGEDGIEVPLVDDSPKLGAMDRMLKAMERLAKLGGLDAATKFENLTLDVVQAEIARLEAEEGGGVAMKVHGWMWPIDANGEAIGAPIELHDVDLRGVTVEGGIAFDSMLVPRPMDLIVYDGPIPEHLRQLFEGVPIMEIRERSGNQWVRCLTCQSWVMPAEGGSSLEVLEHAEETHECQPGR